MTVVEAGSSVQSSRLCDLSSVGHIKLNCLLHFPVLKPEPVSVFPSASQKLLQCVQQELGLEQKILTQLPTISKFETSIAGSLATLQCKHNQEE